MSLPHLFVRFMPRAGRGQLLGFRLGLFLAAFLAAFLGAVYPDDAMADEPDPGYWRLADIETQFEIWAAQYPEIFQSLVLGRSGQGRDIPMALIANQADADHDRPALILHGALHANEPNGTTAIMRSLEVLLAGYGQDPQVTARVDGLRIYFIPILNVDGHAHVFGGAPSWRDWRKTMRDNNGNAEPDFPADGVDLNRNWDWNWEDYEEDDPASQKYKGPYPFSEPEIVAVRDLIQRVRPVVYVDYHSPVTITWRNYVFWPWLDNAGGGGMGPDADVAEDVAELWSDATDNENGSSYNDIFAYSRLPKSQNWVYGRTGILAYIMEIADHCWWSGAMVDTVGHRVSRGSMILLDLVLDGPGVHGSVTDAATGAPLVAEVVLAEMHQDGIGPRLTEAESGFFHRLVDPGTYTITVSCAGYTPQTGSVEVTAPGWTKANFALQRSFSGVAPGQTLEGLLLRHALGSNDAVQLRIPTGWPTARAELFDVRGRRQARLGQNLGSGDHELALPGGLPGGVYLVRVTAGAFQRTERLVVVP